MLFSRSYDKMIRGLTSTDQVAAGIVILEAFDRIETLSAVVVVA